MLLGVLHMCVCVCVCVWQKYRFSPEDMEEVGPLGAGNYGTVLKMNHKLTGTRMAVKVCLSERERGVEGELVLVSLFRPPPRKSLCQS